MAINSLLFSILFHLCLAPLGLAAPVSTESLDSSWHYGTGGGLIGLIILVLDIIVIVEVIKSSRPPVHKLLWCLIVFLFPLVGLIVYYIFSNRSAYQRGSGYEVLS
ncbi:uncharacterized protein C8A04DRAFT_39552 [Dichotomopilus funicola]|uniref:Cardiolipin synthase N-terminal domain-containing protein n=1 Tax=Dichotomopilus funicola TaxID=1934379 RepID=A0AAN6UXF5_9PEZI|nr:hypothetical protein C8A04DRAFT_39552 [Dichotomopilus funicola]